jgi:hypothetical protein
MGIFGWSYPAGAANDPNAPWNQVEGPCDVCGKPCDYCICPECGVCGEQGNPLCYDDHGDPHHGLTRSAEQKASRRALEREEEEIEKCERDEAAYWADTENRKREDAEMEQYWRDLEQYERSKRD